MKELVRILKSTYQYLMIGISYMAPSVATGSISLAVSVMLYDKDMVPDAAVGPNLGKLFDIGVAGLTLTVPSPAAYINYSTAERSALTLYAIGAWVGNSFDAGSFGALIAGIISGIVVHCLREIPIHRVLRSIMPIFVIPIVGTFAAADIIMWGLGKPVDALATSLTRWLQDMQQGNIVLLAIIVGLMLIFDVGGLISKVAYIFILICAARGAYTVAAIAAVRIYVSSLNLGLATLIGHKSFSSGKREADGVALATGCVGVVEGITPFTAADPLRAIPSIMVDSACGTVTTVLFGTQRYVSWGGLIVLPIVEGKLDYIVTVAVGAIVTAIRASTLKDLAWKKVSRVDQKKDDLDLDFEVNQVRNES